LVGLWLEELAKGALLLLANPLFYWVFILVFIAGYRRIKRERQQFGVKIYDYFSEWKGTWLPALLIGLIYSIILTGAGAVFSYGTLIVFSILMIIMSISGRFTLLSPGFTAGLGFIILLILPGIWENLALSPTDLFLNTNFLSIAFLIGFMLFAEAIFIRRTRRQETFPGLVKSARGIWTGEQQLRKMTVVPLILLVPGGAIESFNPYWPLLSIGEATYGFVLFPFLLGFSFRVRAELAPVAGRVLSNQLIWLAILVLAISVGGYFLNGLSLLAIIVAIVGREFITYRFRLRQKQQNPLYKPQEEGLRVLGVIPGTPAARLGIQTGEVIAKVNDMRVNSKDALYEALQTSGASFKLDVLDDAGEVRFIQSAFYETDHYQLGLLFAGEPYRNEPRNEAAAAKE